MYSGKRASSPTSKEQAKSVETVYTWLSYVSENDYDKRVSSQTLIMYYKYVVNIWLLHYCLFNGLSVNILVFCTIMACN